MNDRDLIKRIEALTAEIAHVDAVERGDRMLDDEHEVLALLERRDAAQRERAALYIVKRAREQRAAVERHRDVWSGYLKQKIARIEELLPAARESDARRLEVDLAGHRERLERIQSGREVPVGTPMGSW